MNDAARLRGPGPLIFVDDDPADRELVERCFRRSRASLRRELMLMENSRELLEFLDAVAAGTEDAPSVILLDIRMPAPDGLETLEIIRWRAASQEVPVTVMLTNSNHEDDIEKADELGADGFQTKPYRVKEIVDFLDSLLPEDE